MERDDLLYALRTYGIPPRTLGPHLGVYNGARRSFTNAQTGQSAGNTVHHVLLVRLLLYNYLTLPTEIISIILDYADLWPSTIYVITRDEEPLLGYHELITTLPLGDSMEFQNPENRVARALLRGPCPCRQIRVKLWAKAEARSEDVRRRQHPFPRPRHIKPLTINVVWPNYEDDLLYVPETKRRRQVFSASNLPFVLGLPIFCDPKERRESPRWSIPVIERPLTEDAIEEKEVVWDWNDPGLGGDLVRCLEVGDALQIRTNHNDNGPGIVLPHIEVEISYAV